MKHVLKKTAVGIAYASLIFTVNAQAANWLMLQGTENPSEAPRAKVWGFIQPTYKYTEGTEVQAGPWKGADAQFNLHAPHLSSNSQFSIQRARIGVRGQGHPLNAKVNYFILAEFGSNGITWPNEGFGSAKLTDASVTLNYIPGARVRAGLFKTPTAEEGLQAIHVFDYVNFTTFSDQMLLERQFKYDGTSTTDPNAPIGPVGSFRDIGVQIFDSFMIGGSWDLSYAVMMGNGSGINGGNNNDKFDSYAYFSVEKVFGKTGPKQEGVKMFAWGQQGKRDLINGATDVSKQYERKRNGVGVTFRKSIFRASAEYMLADGMIFNGTDGGAKVGSVSTVNGQTASFNMEPEEEADGYYAHFGILVIRNLELDLRYDVLNRATKKASNERKFDTVTLGAQWFFDQKNRLTFNYEIRNAEAPNAPASNTANLILDGMDDRLSLQITSIF